MLYFTKNSILDLQVVMESHGGVSFAPKRRQI